MADRETVIQGLQKVSGYFKSMLKVGYDGDKDIYTKHREAVKKAIELLKEQEPMTPEEFKDGLLKMFSSIWKCEIDHPMFQDTVGELMSGVIQLYKKAVKWDE